MSACSVKFATACLRKLHTPPFKPVSIGDETLREKHAHFLALDHNADELQRYGFVEKPSVVLQGRIPPEVSYLRELALLMERRGEDARARCEAQLPTLGFGPHQHGGGAVDERFTLFDYTQYDNVILQGQYSYPVTIHLPEWLPQSHLCFNTPDPKKPGVLNTFKIRYDLIAAIERFS